MFGTAFGTERLVLRVLFALVKAQMRQNSYLSSEERKALGEVHNDLERALGIPQPKESEYMQAVRRSASQR